MTVTLGELADRLGAEVIASDPTLARTLEVADVTHVSSATAGPATMFVAVVGEESDGHDFVADAAHRGAVAAITERVVHTTIPLLIVPSSRAAMGPAADLVHRSPSRRLTLVGVTGTNGKTTVVTLIGQLLELLGQPAEVIGTLTGARTTPEATDLQRQLSGCADRGIEVVAMEVSSHALALHRVDGSLFRVAVFTNLGRDHLDFHETQERYFQAKARLFEADRAQLAVLNVDDVHGRLLRDVAMIPVVEYSVDALRDLQVGSADSRFTWRDHDVVVRLAGAFNVSNALAAAEVAVALGHPPASVAAALADVTAPAGRLERVEASAGAGASEAARPVVLVDYAHTPDALDAVLTSLRPMVGAEGRVLVVVGCGGDRDRSKRPDMARVAVSMSDLAWFTSDNPRSEDPATIMEAMLAGVLSDRRSSVGVDVDRRRAIFSAVAAARAGDVVLIAGKGHETTQTVGDRVTPFDDRQVAADALAAWTSREASE